MSNLLLRWSIGNSDTTTRSEMSDEKFKKFIRMAKLSVYSFQKFFDADFVIGYNGTNFDRFFDFWHTIEPSLKKEVHFINQRDFPNPYETFFPIGGIWWKWIPFRYDVSKTEISIDTDIICMSEPKSWYEWIDNDTPLLIPKEAIPEICESTCGDVWNHIVLKDKVALNCGIIGQKSGVDVSSRFFDLTKLVDCGTYHGNFVTEQGLFNILYYSLESEGIKHFVLPYKKNLQAKHLYSYMGSGEKIETVHFTARTKLIFYDLYNIFKNRIDGTSTNIDVLSALTEWYVLNKKLLQ
jgi:hypothetical protein